MTRLREREHIRALVSAYLDGELPPDDAAYVGRMIQEDPAYGQVYAAYRGIRMQMRAMPQQEVPPAVSSAIRARTAMLRQGRRPTLSLGQRVARLSATVASLAAALAAIFTQGFGLPAHFIHGTGPIGPNAPQTVRVSGVPTTATVLNTQVRFDESAEIRFTNGMNESTVKSLVQFSPAVPLVNLAYDSKSFTLSTKPKTLQLNKTYTVTIPPGLKDIDGNEVTPTAFNFAVLPPNTSLQADATEVASPTPLALPTKAPTVAVPTAAPTIVAVANPTADVTATTAVTTSATDAPTVATAPVTPTDEPAIVAVVPTNTAKPAPRVTATTAPAPKATATTAPAATTAPVAPTATTVPTAAPTVAATATTAAPTATAVPATPTAAPPTATTPTIPVSPKFTNAYEQTANRLGSPAGSAQNVSTTHLFFQNGQMVYVTGQGSFYVLYSGSGTWQTVPIAQDNGMITPVAGKPSGAYGATWVKSNLQGKLGNAQSSAESAAAGTIQRFEGGTILAVGGDVYVLFNNGSFQLFGG